MTQFVYYNEKCVAIIESEYVPHKNDELEIDDVIYCIDDVKYKTLRVNKLINSHVITGVEIRVDKSGRLY